MLHRDEQGQRDPKRGRIALSERRYSSTIIPAAARTEPPNTVRMPEEIPARVVTQEDHGAKHQHNRALISTNTKAILNVVGGMRQLLVLDVSIILA